MSPATWLAVGVLAVLSGTLLRLSLELGVPALRMLGFWCLVGIGLLAARAAGRSQEESARRELRSALASLGDDYAPLVDGCGPGTVAVVGPGGVAVLVEEGLAHYGRGPMVRRRLARAGARARAAAAALARAAGACGLDVPVRAAVVFLRRRPRSGEEALLSVPVLNPDSAAEWVRSAVGGEGGLPPEGRRRLAEALRHAGAG